MIPLKLIVQNSKIVLKTMANYVLNITGIKDSLIGDSSVTNNKINWTLQEYTNTASWFTINNPILLLGQKGIETDDLLTAPKFKIGDGITAWNSLPYVSSGLPKASEVSYGSSDVASALNSRLTSQVIQITSSTAPTVNTTGYRRTFVDITALAGNVNLSTNLTGTPQNGDVLIYQIKDNGTARTITIGTLFEAKGESLPTTTVISKRINIGATWDSTTSKWGVLAVQQEI